MQRFHRIRSVDDFADLLRKFEERNHMLTDYDCIATRELT
jgi:hypothetical protein